MLLRRVARPLLAGIFIQGGISALRDPKSHTDMAVPVLQQVRALAPVELPPHQRLVQIDGGVKIGAGLLLALGKLPRLSAALLAGSLVPTTFAGHRFWEVHDPNERVNQKAHLAKNLGLLGGLLLAAVDTEGRPSLAWRARRGRRGGGTGAAASRAEVASSEALRRARKVAKKARKRTAKRLEGASREASKKLDRARRRASKDLDQAAKDASRKSSRQLKRARG